MLTANAFDVIFIIVLTKNDWLTGAVRSRRPAMNRLFGKSKPKEPAPTLTDVIANVRRT